MFIHMLAMVALLTQLGSASREVALETPHAKLYLPDEVRAETLSLSTKGSPLAYRHAGKSYHAFCTGVSEAFTSVKYRYDGSIALVEYQLIDSAHSRSAANSFLRLIKQINDDFERTIQKELKDDDKWVDIAIRLHPYSQEQGYLAIEIEVVITGHIDWDGFLFGRLSAISQTDVREEVLGRYLIVGKQNYLFILYASSSIDKVMWNKTINSIEFKLPR